MKTWHILALGVLIGLLAAGILILTCGTPRGEPVTLLPPPTKEPLTVHITGAVFQPGVYQLSQSARVEDAIQAAGGLKPLADPQSINLAKTLEDGERIWIPSQATVIPSEPSRPTSLPTLEPPSSEHPINVNQATVEELDLLPGIGPVKAQAIVNYRETHGFFQTIEQVRFVEGIGPSLYERIKDLITTGSQE